MVVFVMVKFILYWLSYFGWSRTATMQSVSKYLGRFRLSVLIPRKFASCGLLATARLSCSDLILSYTQHILTLTCSGNYSSYHWCWVKHSRCNCAILCHIARPITTKTSSWYADSCCAHPIMLYHNNSRPIRHHCVRILHSFIMIIVSDSDFYVVTSWQAAVDCSHWLFAHYLYNTSTVSCME